MRHWIWDRAGLIKTVTLVRFPWHSKVSLPLPKRQRFNMISQTSFQISLAFYIVLAIIATEHLPSYHQESETRPPKNNKESNFLNVSSPHSVPWVKVYWFSASFVTNDHNLKCFISQSYESQVLRGNTLWGVGGGQIPVHMEPYHEKLWRKFWKLKICKRSSLDLMA